MKHLLKKIVVIKMKNTHVRVDFLRKNTFRCHIICPIPASPVGDQFCEVNILLGGVQNLFHDEKWILDYHHYSRVLHWAHNQPPS